MTPLAEFVRNHLGLSSVRDYADAVKAMCPFHPGSSGRTLSIWRGSGYWHCYSTRCVYNSGGPLELLCILRQADPTVGRGCLDRSKELDEPWKQGMVTLADLDAIGKVRWPHMSFFKVDWHLARQCCEAIRLNAAQDFPAQPGKLEHDCWLQLAYPLYQRSITPSALELYRVGYDRERNELVFPIASKAGALLGTARRRCAAGSAAYILSGSMWPPGHEEHRYFPVRRGDSLWGYHTQPFDGKRPLFVVEGYFDALRLSSVGYLAVAKLGDRLTDPQADLLAEHINENRGSVIIWPDFDKAGIEALIFKDIPKLASRHIFDEVEFLINVAVKDPGDLHDDAQLVQVVEISRGSSLELDLKSTEILNAVQRLQWSSRPTVREMQFLVDEARLA